MYPPVLMERLINEEALRRWLSEEGFVIVSFKGDGTLWGYTCQTRKEVGLWTGLLSFQIIPTLLHEAIHVSRDDHGHQSASVEQRIDESVAQLLVVPERYAWAEMQYGCHGGVIARELGLPRWVIEAYQRMLARM